MASKMTDEPPRVGDGGAPTAAVQAKESIEKENATPMMSTKTTTLTGDAPWITASDGGDTVKSAHLAELASFAGKIDETIRMVAKEKNTWAKLPAAEKRDLLQACLNNLRRAEVMKRMEDAVKKRKGYSEETVGSEGMRYADIQSKMMGELHIASWLTYLRDVYDSLALTGSVIPPQSILRNYDNTLRLNVTPSDVTSKVTSSQCHIELHVKGQLKSTQSGEENGESVRRGDTSVADPRIVLDGSCKLSLTNNDRRHSETMNKSKGEEQRAKDVDLLAEVLTGDPTKRPAGVVAILGATNYEAPIDLLSSLFCENKVCIYKFSPMTAVLQDVMEEIFKPLLEKKILAFIQGGSDEAQFLLNHPLVTKWYLTGSKATADKILWGDRVPNKDSVLYSEPRIQKPFVAELGGCGPWIVCPGRWSNSDLQAHAKALAFALLFNGAHVCVHPQIIITCRQWTQREAFLDNLRDSLKSAPFIGCFFPDAISRLDEMSKLLVKEGKQIEDFTIPMQTRTAAFDEDTKNIILCTNCGETSSLCTMEAFCPACIEVPLATDPTIAAFLPSAVKFANEKAEGNLCATVICNPSNKDDEEVLDAAVCDLRFGSVGVNGWGLMTIKFPMLCWGAYPAASPMDELEFTAAGKGDGMASESDGSAEARKVAVEAARRLIKSGVGGFGNVLNLDGVLKSVIRHHFRGYHLHMESMPSIWTPPRVQKTLSRVTAMLCDRPAPSAGALSSIGTAQRLMKAASGLFFNL